MALQKPTTKLPRHDFKAPGELAADLADAVAVRLRAGLAARGEASLAVSGGRTPERFLAALAQQTLDWARVTVTLVDDRWVPLDSPRSNEALLRRSLLQGPAATARLVGLVCEAVRPEDGVAEVSARIAALPRPFDVVVLGMGTDGHTASFFPQGDHLDEALDPAGAQPVIPMQAPGAGEPRITLSLPLIVGARAVYLHIEGTEKSEVLERALQDGPAKDMPIRAVLRHPGVPLEIYWCP